MTTNGAEPCKGTPALRQMLIEQGYVTKHDRGVHLWVMFHAVYQRMRDIALEIEYNEKESAR